MFKIIIIGDPNCGKTSMLLRATLNKETDSHVITVGVDCKSKMMKRDDKTIKL